MLEAGMSLVAVNLPSLWILTTTSAPGRFLRSVRSVIPSLRRKGSHICRIHGHGNILTRSEYKGAATASMDSNRTMVLSQPIPAYTPPRNVAQQISGDLENQKYEVYVMHEYDVTESHRGA